MLPWVPLLGWVSRKWRYLWKNLLAPGKNLSEASKSPSAAQQQLFKVPSAWHPPYNMIASLPGLRGLWQILLVLGKKWKSLSEASECPLMPGRGTLMSYGEELRIFVPSGTGCYATAPLKPMGLKGSLTFDNPILYYCPQLTSSPVYFMWTHYVNRVLWVLCLPLPFSICSASPTLPSGVVLS